MGVRIQLRHPTWEDMVYIRSLWSDSETMDSIGGPIHLSDDQALGWFKWRVDPGRPTDCYYLIIDEGGQPIGEVSFHQLDPDTMTAMFNLKIASSKRGKGFARQAMLHFLDYYFNEIDGEVMLDDIALDNLRGQDVLRRFGFEHDPSVGDVYRVKMTKDQFNELHRV